MALRNGHGSGAGVPRVEVRPATELPNPVADSRSPISGVERRQNGRVATPTHSRKQSSPLVRQGELWIERVDS
jgi:hypothetical protein